MASLRRSKTIRISRIPKAVTLEKLTTWVDGLALSVEPPETQNLIQISLAPEDAEFAQATATFLCLPSQFEDLGENARLCDGPDKCRLTVDTHFVGMTVLYDPVQAGAGPAVAE